MNGFGSFWKISRKFFHTCQAVFFMPGRRSGGIHEAESVKDRQRTWQELGRFEGHWTTAGKCHSAQRRMFDDCYKPRIGRSIQFDGRLFAPRRRNHAPREANERKTNSEPLIRFLKRGLPTALGRKRPRSAERPRRSANLSAPHLRETAFARACLEW